MWADAWMDCGFTSLASKTISLHQNLMIVILQMLDSGVQTNILHQHPQGCIYSTNKPPSKETRGIYWTSPIITRVGLAKAQLDWEAIFQTKLQHKRCFKSSKASVMTNIGPSARGLLHVLKRVDNVQWELPSPVRRYQSRHTNVQTSYRLVTSSTVNPLFLEQLN